MNNQLLSNLLLQAQQQGADIATLRAMIEEASDMGAQRALARLGLADRKASSDISELRQLLQAWRDTKRSAWQAVVGWCVRLVLAGVLLGVAAKWGWAFKISHEIQR